MFRPIVIVTCLIYLVQAHPDERLSTKQFMAKYGYPIEDHSVTTQDGYILTAQRIPHSPNGQKPTRVVLLVHGMGGKGANYLILGPPDALAFYMSDRGYDVWLFNARGTELSRKHKTLNPNRDRKKFWNFSWNEIALFDLPATIDYIVRKTGADKLFYVGHSQGTTSCLIMLSEVPEINDRISAAALLAPAVFLNLTKSPILTAASKLAGLAQVTSKSPLNLWMAVYFSKPKRLLGMFNWYELPMPNSPMLNNILLSLCRPPMDDLCLDIVYLIGGPTSGLVDKSIVPMALKFGISGIASKQIFHYGQVILSGEFKKYDYGSKGNLKMYNNTKPPLYQLHNVRAPMALFYSVEDPFGNNLMMEKLKIFLPNVALDNQMSLPNWNHLDFILARNLRQETQIIKKHNYPVEEHTITTADSYVLKTFRIPHGQQGKPESRNVVLLGHGLASSSDDWILLGPDSLAYHLVDSGFDVWLFNARGTRHSRKHLKLDPEANATDFWNFSWEEIGLYDLPANIDYILNHTGAAKLFYVGHSQGGTANLVMLSQLPKMNEKIMAASLLAPAVYFVNEKSVALLKVVAVLFSPRVRKISFYEFPPKSSSHLTDISNQLCSFPGLITMCYNTIYFGAQLENHPIDQKLIPLIVQHAPSTLSTKQIHHYTQIMQSGEFKRFDYGTRRNLKTYGFSKPPVFDLSRITTPMLIFYGNGDFLASPLSVQKITNELTNQHEVVEVPFDGFDHVDFLWARNAKELIYEKTLEMFQKYVN
ncbi:hypothetical protein YQE_06014, partial [Dendroctonus ponderosae]